MEATDLTDVPVQPTDAPTLRIRVPVYDALAAAKGHKTVESQAVWHELARSTMFRLRAGEIPRLDTAMRIAADCGVPVEVIWERVT